MDDLLKRLLLAGFNAKMTDIGIIVNIGHAEFLVDFGKNGWCVSTDGIFVSERNHPHFVFQALCAIRLAVDEPVAAVRRRFKFGDLNVGMAYDVGGRPALMFEDAQRLSSSWTSWDLDEICMTMVSSNAADERSWACPVQVVGAGTCWLIHPEAKDVTVEDLDVTKLFRRATQHLALRWYREAYDLEWAVPDRMFEAIISEEADRIVSNIRAVLGDDDAITEQIAENPNFNQYVRDAFEWWRDRLEKALTLPEEK